MGLLAIRAGAMPSPYETVSSVVDARRMTKTTRQVNFDDTVLLVLFVL